MKNIIRRFVKRNNMSEYRIVKTEKDDTVLYHAQVNYHVAWKDVLFPTCYTLSGASGASLKKSILQFRTPEEAKEMISEFYEKPTSEVYKGHKLVKRFRYSSWKIIWVDLDWRMKDYGKHTKTYNSGKLENLKQDIDRKYNEPKKSIVERWFL